MLREQIQNSAAVNFSADFHQRLHASKCSKEVAAIQSYEEEQLPLVPPECPKRF